MKYWMIWLVVLLSLCGTPLMAAAPEAYWICFLKQSQGEMRNSKYVMQIDARGSILIKPTKLTEGIAYHRAFDMEMSSNGPSEINLWYTTPRGGAADPIYRLVFDRKTFRVLRVIRTNLHAFRTRLTMTHQPAANRIGVNVPQKDFSRTAAYPIKLDGTIAGPGWYISPPSPGRSGEIWNGGISSGGRLAYWFRPHGTVFSSIDDMFIQVLGPVGSPVYLDRIVSYFVRHSYFSSADATQILPGNKILVVYVKAQPPTDIENAQRIFLQAVNASTGRKRGARVFLHAAANITGHVKIEPLGRFIVFSQFDDASSIGSLRYLALDSTGHPVGRPVLLFNEPVTGIDLLPDWPKGSR